MYAIIDIETTGGRSRMDRITEIAVFIHDGRKVINEFATLVQPEQVIPYFITGLTGITNEMVAEAPHFFEVARKIVEITEDCTFVAHNARFDYSFEQAKETLYRFTDEYHLCQKLMGLYDSSGSCFQYQIGICLGACVGKELPDSYNKRAEKVLESFRFSNQNFLVIDTGRDLNEKSVVKIKNGKYLGFGYFDAAEKPGHNSD